MRFYTALSTALLAVLVASSAIDSSDSKTHISTARNTHDDSDSSEHWVELWKRKGGGGGGGRGGGGARGGSSRGSSSRGGSRGGGGGGGSRGGGSSSGRGTNTRPTSNVGGYSRTGTGPQPSIAGGKFYAGGARVPFASGATSRGISPTRTPVAGMGYWPGLWLAPVMLYPYASSHRYYNRTNNRNETADIECGCEQFAVCACEEIEDQDYWEDMLKDGDYSRINQSVVRVTERDGKKLVLVNGTLPNGTTVPSDDPEDYAEYLENMGTTLRVLGMWPAVAAVAAAVLLA